VEEKNNMPIIVREIKRPSKNLIEEFRKVPVANIADAFFKPSSNVVSSDIQPLLENVKIAGPALTVREMPGCNLMTHKALHLAQPGDIVVIDLSGDTRTAVAGFFMARKAKSLGVEAFVIDGACRDKQELKEMMFQAYVRAWTPNGPSKDRPGDINLPIQCGGVVVEPGDIVVGDDDGVVVVPRDLAPKILQKAKEIFEREEKGKAVTDPSVIQRMPTYATDENLKNMGIEIR
jgi:regulator of RNase E activity RraA